MSKNSRTPEKANTYTFDLFPEEVVHLRAIEKRHPKWQKREPRRCYLCGKTVRMKFRDGDCCC